MKMFLFTADTCLSLLLLSVVCAAGFDSVNKNLVNKDVERTIDVSTHLVKINTKITLENEGQSPVRSFLYAGVDASTPKERLAHISAQQTVGSDKVHLRLVETQTQEQKGKPFWKIELNKPIPVGQTAEVDVDTVLSHVLQPHPPEITQKEKQLIRYHSSAYLYTPYPTTSQTTKILLSSSNVESYTKLKPVSLADTTITYGPYENVAAFTFDNITVHYENNNPFLTVTYMDRVIEVSHWGNIAIEETLDIKHTGAVLKGSFSRYEYQREQTGISSIKSLKTVLPASASDVYYCDEIGNISTSHMKVLDDAVELDLRPRFPLFGGWKSHYVIGYNVPSYEYLYNSGDEYVLAMRFVDHIYDDMVVEHFTLKIILPEGSKDLQFSPPFPCEKQPDSLHFTYLDTQGRPVITFTKSNMVENHIQDFELRYTFPRIVMLQEPLLLVLAFYLLFLVVIIYVRLDFSITKDEAGESKMRVAGYCENLASHQDKRASMYQHYDDLLIKLKSAKDIAAFQSAMKNLNTEHKKETQLIEELLTKMKQEGGDVTEKVSELQKLDRNLKELLNQQGQYAEKLVAGKMNKQQYIDTETYCNKKKDDILEKISNIMKSL